MIEQDGRVIAMLVPPEEYLPVKEADIPPEFWQGLVAVQDDGLEDRDGVEVLAAPLRESFRSAIDCTFRELPARRLRPDNLLLNLFSIGFFDEPAFASDRGRPGWPTCHRAAAGFCFRHQRRGQLLVQPE